MQGYNFTDQVRRTLAQAREEAAELHHEYVGTEHMLLALLRQEDGVVADVMKSLSVDVETTRQVVIDGVKKGRGFATGPDLPTPLAGRRHSSSRWPRLGSGVTRMLAPSTCSLAWCASKGASARRCWRGLVSRSTTFARRRCRALAKRISLNRRRSRHMPYAVSS